VCVCVWVCTQCNRNGGGELCGRMRVSVGVCEEEDAGVSAGVYVQSRWRGGCMCVQ